MATQQVVNVGSQANDATGDLLRDAFTKINTNFAVFFAGNFPTAQMTIGPPLTGNALTAVGITGSAAIVATAASVTDISITATGTASFAGGVTFGSPTGGNKGAGSINTTSLFVNNVAVLTGSSGVSSFTSNTGLSANVAATGAVTVTNTGVLSLTTNTGLSSNVSATGAITVTNTGVTSLAGTANQVAVSASTGAVTLTLPQNLIIPTPGSGIALTLTGLAAAAAIQITAAPIFVNNNGNPALQLNSLGSNYGIIGNVSSNLWGIGTATVINGAWTQALTWNATGNVIVNNPSSGIAFTVTGSSAGIAAMTFNTMATTGAQSVILSITNKPGASAQTQPAKWLPLSLDGTTYYVPAFS
jgi:hypothetical protein